MKVFLLLIAFFGFCHCKRPLNADRQHSSSSSDSESHSEHVRRVQDAGMTPRRTPDTDSESSSETSDSSDSKPALTDVGKSYICPTCHGSGRVVQQPGRKQLSRKQRSPPHWRDDDCKTISHSLWSKMKEILDLRGQEQIAFARNIGREMHIPLRCMPPTPPIYLQPRIDNVPPLYHLLH